MVPELHLQASMRVPCGGGGSRGSSSSSSSGSGSLFGVTPNGQYLAVGTSSGSVLVFDTRTGVQAATVEGLRAGHTVRCCALSADCRHLLAVSGNGFIFRFEYIRPSVGAAPHCHSEEERATGTAEPSGGTAPPRHSEEERAGSMSQAAGASLIVARQQGWQGPRSQLRSR